MNRPNWYEDEPASGKRFEIPPPTMWSGTVQLLVLLIVVLFFQLTIGLGRYIELDRAKVGNPLHWYRFATYALAHSEHSVLHLFFNALTIWFFGNPVESELGSRRGFHLFALAAAVLSGLTWLLVEVIFGGGAATLVGASGIAFALIVAFATYDPHRSVMVWVIEMKAWVLATVVMLFALFGMLMSPGGGVAHVAHLAGGLFGFAAVRYRGKVDDLVMEIEHRRDVAAREHAADTRREVDRILDKIHTSGMTSLTKAERKFLETASKDLQRKR
jgi:membrane associated rhomboid family serine protease